MFTDGEKEMLIAAITENGSTDHPIPTYDNLTFFTTNFLLHCARQLCHADTFAYGINRYHYGTRVTDLHRTTLRAAIAKLEGK